MFIFKQLLENEKLNRSESFWIKIRRDQIYEDSYESWRNLGNRLKGQTKISMVNEHGIFLK